MGSRYLLELADWCREAGLTVIEDAGWQYRARGSGGFDPGQPWCVMWHHTASGALPQNDVNYICRISPTPPVANLFLARDGRVWVCAGGASNTNGKGGPVTVSKGVIGRDLMNRYALGIEAANNGIGEDWKQVQIDAYFALNSVLTKKLGLLPTDLLHHHSWSPGRKIDCARAAAVQGPWRPSSVNSSGSWSLLDTQTEAAYRATPAPPEPEPLPPPVFVPGEPAPPSTKDEDNMLVALDSAGTAWVGDGVTRFALTDEAVFSNYVLLGKSGAIRFVNTAGQVVSGWPNVQTVGDATLAALGREA